MLLAGCSTLKSPAGPRETTIWVVRHAEKATDDAEDPSLSDQGRARAEALAVRLEGEGIDAIFSSPYRRTRSTAEPLAERIGQEIRRYEAKDFAGLRERLLGEFRGKEVLVVGHSNTVLPIIEALGARRPVEALSDGDYDYLFKVSVPGHDGASVEIERYGSGP